MLVPKNPIETTGGFLIHGPVAPYQVAAKVGRGIPLLVAQDILGVEFTDPATGLSLGLRARATAVLVVGNVEATDTVTVGATTYEFDDGVALGDTAEVSAANLAAAISADTDILVAVIGRTVYLAAAAEGEAGNELVLATNASARITVSGATFAGGTDPEESEEE